MHGAVVHKPVDDAKKTKLEKEFQKVLPQRRQGKSEFQFELFEARSDDSFNAINYIVGRAALLSLDVDMAIQLHEPLFNIVEEEGGIPIEIEELKAILSIEYGFKMRIALKEQSREAYRSATQKSLRFRSGEYSRLIMKSIVEFDLGNGNPEKSLELIDEASNLPQTEHDKTHLYNKAFLNFWLENYQVAVASCERLKGVNYEGEIDAAEQVVKFCELVINSTKPQLHFFMGFIYLDKLDNYPMAYKHFKMFLDKASSSIEGLERRAESYIETLEKQFEESD